MSFATDFKLARQEVEREIVNRVTTLAYNIVQGCVYNSPTDLDNPDHAGTFKANWQIGINNRPINELSDRDLGGESAINKAYNKLDDVRLGNSIYLVNNVPYAHVIEYGLYTRKPATRKTIGGYSTQAPKGVLRLSVKREIERFKMRYV